MVSTDDYYFDEYTDEYDVDSLFTYRDWTVDEKSYFDEYLSHIDSGVSLTSLSGNLSSTSTSSVLAGTGQSASSFVYSFIDLTENCISPSLTQLFSQLLYILIYCFVFRLLCSTTFFSHRTLHRIQIFASVLLLYNYFQFQSFLLFSYILLSYLSFQLCLSKCRIFLTHIIICFSVIYLLTCEFFLIEQEKWHRIRGVQMCLMMKMISLSIDYKYFEQQYSSSDEDDQQQTKEHDTLVKCPSTIEFLSYILSINNTVFGPWLNYRNYIKYFQPKKNIVVIRKIDFFELSKWFYCLFKICLCLIISNCFTDWLQQITISFSSNTDGSGGWTNAYLQALTYRFSHYCICFIGELFGLVSGIEFDVEDYKNYQEIHQQYTEKLNVIKQVITQIPSRKKSHEKKNKQLSKKVNELKEDDKHEELLLKMSSVIMDNKDPMISNTVEIIETNKDDVEEDSSANMDENKLSIPEELTNSNYLDTTETMNDNHDDNIEGGNHSEIIHHDDKIKVYPLRYRSPIIRRSTNTIAKKKPLSSTSLKRKVVSSHLSSSISSKQQTSVPITKKSSSLSSSVLSRSSSIVKPYEIEFPHSLVDVVINWNIPMHYWLKIYVYKLMKSKYSHFSSIFVTYLASALLHGFNFQLSIVLLSIGIFAYVEYGFRKKLSEVLDSCVMAKYCSSCDHTHTYWHPLTFTVNCLLSALSLWHLTYLGQLFDNSQQQYIGYSLQHTLEKWSKLNFASHIVVICTYAVFRSL